MTTLYTRYIHAGVYTISVSDNSIKVEYSSPNQGVGYAYVIDKKYLPDINTSNAEKKIDELLYYKQTSEFGDVVVKYWSGKTPFAVADSPNHRNVMV